MHEVVSAVNRVTDIMAEISAASDEQSKGISQVADAVTNMDGVTQQNAALVEEAAQATRSLEEQASSLTRVVATFRLNEQAQQRPAIISPPAKTQSLLRPGKKSPVAIDDNNWEKF
ncbi:MAG: Methyl-accepting chemotaxis protein III [Candidatus Erwinia impunctatus]|nr:Methyl-accepting chemotaxis protein III [Culicoides impunctatus]